MKARFVRLAEAERPTVRLLVDGEPIEALQGDTLMVALLTPVWSLTPGQLCCVSQGKHISVEPFHIHRFATSSQQRSKAL